MAHPVEHNATRIGAAMAVTTPRWAQVQITLPPAKRGCHLITQRVAAACAQEMKHIEIGLAHVFSACPRSCCNSAGFASATF